MTAQQSQVLVDAFYEWQKQKDGTKQARGQLWECRER